MLPKTTLVLLVCVASCGDPGVSPSGPGLGGKTEAADQSLWSLDFTDLPKQVRPALEERGFTFERGMGDDSTILLSSADSRLTLSARRATLGLLLSSWIEVNQAEWIEVDWGIEQYPTGADWTHGPNREAVAIYIFLGEKVSSGSWFLPNAPRFIAVFLEENAPLRQLLVGNSYQSSGRYASLGNPEPGEATTSRFNFAEAYRSVFGSQTKVPPVTRIAIEVDTRGLTNGQSSAFLSRITLGKTAN